MSCRYKKCIDSLELKKRHWVTDKREDVRFNLDTSPDRAAIAGYRHVVCEIDENESKISGWKFGYYRSEVTPGQAVERLGRPRDPWENV